MKNIFKTFVFLLLCISNTSTFAASKIDSIENNIFKAKRYNVGFYKNYEEFLRNSPSLNKKTKISKRNLNSVVVNGGGLYTMDYLLNDTTIEYNWNILNGIIKESWGYCDGESIYVFDRMIYKHKGRNMSKIKLLDNISLIEHYEVEYAKSNTNSAMLMGGVIGNVIMSNINKNRLDLDDSTKYANLFHPDFTYMLDNTSNGKIVLFYYKSVMELLYYKDPELYDQFMKEDVKARKELLPYYVLQFNKRNPIK